MKHTVIRGGRLLDGAADILIQGDVIAEVGKVRIPPDAQTIDARGRLLHPGLVNAHMHGHGNLGKGMGDRWTLELLLTAGPWINGHRSTEDKYLTTLIGAAEMVMKGCTACYDLTVEFPVPSVEGLEAAGRAYREAGMRAVLAPMVADISFFEALPGLVEALPAALQKEVERLRLAPYRTTLEHMRKALQAWKFDRDEVRPAVAPTIPLHCSDEFMVACARLAREFGVGLHTHVSESKVQAIAGLKKYGKTLTAHMDALGLVGPDFTAAHGVWLDDDDMKRLADRGASVAHNPGSNMRLGSGLADMRRMLDHGVNVGIGTDGANCSDNLNMYEAMRLASLVSKVQGPDWQRWITTREVLQAATVGSAKALGFGDKIGRLAPGYKADIAFLDLEHINWIPLNDPTNALVHTEDGSAVHSVMVGGKMVVENRRLLNVDLAKLARDAENARERLEELNRENKALYERLEPIVGSFCPGLAKMPYHINRYGAWSPGC
ncbi:MAG: amidohydrolase [Betaproteobacteria bacterium RIFCSPLOWO2_12_FULL_65_14]|nr:MAG: amidohydrolase [Betaproteobacteria bacterium RIFCSPLOWO2_12_FULL_65_14]